MPRPDRYNVNRIPPEAVSRFAAWVLAYDEEGEEGQDEATIKPNEAADPELPGFVTADVHFANGGTGIALLGGATIGVSTFDDLDDFRLYLDGKVWLFDLESEQCTQDWPRGELLIDIHPELWPLSLTARMRAAFGAAFDDYSFTVSSDGTVVPPDSP